MNNLLFFMKARVLMFFMVVLLFCFFSLEVLALPYVRVGSHGYETNLYVNFYLQNDLTAGGYIRIYFDSEAEGSATTHQFLTNLDEDKDFDILAYSVAGGDTYSVEKSLSPIADATTFAGYKYASGGGYIRLQAPSSFVTLPAGTQMRVSFGAADTADIYSVSTDYASTAVNYILNPPDENADGSVDIAVEIAEGPLGSQVWQYATYYVDTDAVEAGEPAYGVDIRAEAADPYINFKLFTNRMDFGAVSPDNIYRSSISGSISTNSDLGYILYYRAGDLLDPSTSNTIAKNSDLNDSLLPDGIDEAWGLRFYIEQSEPVLASLYTSSFYYDDINTDEYYAAPDFNLHALALTNGPSECFFNLEGGLVVADTTPANDEYINEITFSIFAGF